MEIREFASRPFAGWRVAETTRNVNGGANSAAYANLSLRFKFGRDRLSCCAGKSHETGKNVLAPADLGTQSAHCRGRDHRARAGD